MASTIFGLNALLVLFEAYIYILLGLGTRLLFHVMALFSLVILNVEHVSTDARVAETLIEVVIEADFSFLASCVCLAWITLGPTFVILGHIIDIVIFFEVLFRCGLLLCWFLSLGYHLSVHGFTFLGVAITLTSVILEAYSVTSLTVCGLIAFCFLREAIISIKLLDLLFSSVLPFFLLRPHGIILALCRVAVADA